MYFTLGALCNTYDMSFERIHVINGREEEEGEGEGGGEEAHAHLMI